MGPLVVLSVATACCALAFALGAGALAWHAFAMRRVELDEMVALMRDVERARSEIAAVRMQGRSIEASLREVHASLQTNEMPRYRARRSPLVVWTDDVS